MKKRTTKIENRTMYPGFGNWVISHYADGRFVCETSRRTRKEARAVARKYKESGIIPLN